MSDKTATPYTKQTQRIGFTMPMLWQIIIMFLISSVLVGFIAGERLRSQETEFLLRATEQQYAQLLQVFGNSSQDSILAEDISLLRTIVETLGNSDSQIASITILNDERLPLAEWTTQLAGNPSNYNLPPHVITIQQKYQGEIQLEVDIDSELQEIEKHVHNMQYLLTLLMALLVLVIIFVINRISVRPVQFIEQRLQDFGAGDFRSDFAVAGSAEIQSLVRSINTVAEELASKQQAENQHKAELEQLNTAYFRFVPKNFLEYLQRDSIVDVALGDQVGKHMTILFSDIRNFTTLAEKFTAEETFDFINQYLRHLGPVIRNHNGFIDKYIGDAIMALFESPTDAIEASVAMLEALEMFNTLHPHYPNIRIGIGMHTGTVMLGTIGETNRMESTVIGDVVNLAARLESMTKEYGVPILLSDVTLQESSLPKDCMHRYVDTVLAKGKTTPTTIYEIYTANTDALWESKMHNAQLLQQYLAPSTTEANNSSPKLPKIDVASIDWDDSDPIVASYKAHIDKKYNSQSA